MIINCIKFIVWLLLFLAALEYGTAMMSAPNTVEAVLGVAIIVIAAIVSVLTKCFIGIKVTFYKSKKEKKE